MAIKRMFFIRSFHSLTKSAKNEKDTRRLIEHLSEGKLSLRKIGFGTESKRVFKDEERARLARTFLDYLVVNVESKRLIALCDAQSSRRWSYAESDFIPVSFYKREVMRANADILPSVFIAKLSDGYFWFLGRRKLPFIKVYGETIDCDKTAWTGGLELLVQKLLELP